MSLLPYFYDLHLLRHLPERFGFDSAPDEGDLGKDEWSFSVDVSHFAPDEITVRMADRFVVVEGSHEERRDGHGAVARRFARRHALPERCLADTVRATLSSDGVLTVSAPLKLALPDEGERIVPVQRSGPVLRQRADAASLLRRDPSQIDDVAK